MPRNHRRTGRFNRNHHRVRVMVPHHVRHNHRRRRSRSPSPRSRDASPGRSPSRTHTSTSIIVGRRRRNRPFLGLFGNRHRRPLGFNWGGRVNVIDYGYVRPDDDWTDDDDDDDDDDIDQPRMQGDDPRGTRTREPKPDRDDQEVLNVAAVDFLVPENVKQHHTDEFDITELSRPKLVVRRGQPFNIRITFNRAYNTQKDDLRLVFEIGDQPKPSKGTHVEFILSDKDVKGEWGAAIKDPSSNKTVINIAVFTPPDCIVGVWKFKVDVVKKTDNRTSVFRYNHKDPIYMLFNPWCREDTVFLENESHRNAYVMEDKGKIYAGNYKSISAKPWVFGQFSGNVLDCCMHLLDICELNLAVRGNPIPVCRKLSAMVNSNDDGGVLTGNWSGEYSGGKSPLSWTGSAMILEQYYEQKYSVQFGQCWVFSGVLTTVLRALGIPARSVTNFASAHDVDTSITIDLHYDDDGNPLEELNEDSVWNFHVWNEAWMARSDLPSGYGGWQALDATPQETSDGVMCCGPCPVYAIKEGEVNLPYDGPFVFAEVNADKVYWMIQKDGTNKRVHIEKNAVGKFISTLSLRGEREDVTKHYKHPEDTAEERTAVLRANRVGARGDSGRNAYETGPEDVKFELDFDAENTYVGSDFVVKVRCSNTGKEQRHVAGVLCASTMYYTGVVADEVGKKPFQGVILKPGETKEVALTVGPETYSRRLKDCCMLAVSAMARVKETDQVFTKKDDMRLRKPHLVIKAANESRVGQELELHVSFTNPMHTTLTDCVLEVEATGITDGKQYPQGDVPPKGTFMTTIKLKPKKKGKKQIVAIFNSKQLEDVNGTHDVIVR